MNWLSDLNNAMAYIEDHLRGGDLGMAAVARQAACSTFHLTRMFPYLTGMTLADYIRRRKMSAAALELARGEARVVDVALRYGYESPTSFSRAFRSVHGISPAQARAGEGALSIHPRLVFSLQVKGGVPMECKIVETEEFRVVGVLAGDDWTMEDAGRKAAEFWEGLGAAGTVPHILALEDGSEPSGLLGVSFCEDGTFKGYLVGIATEAPCPEGMVERLVPAATYARFECTGPLPDAMQALQCRIVQEWLPSSGYEWASKADVERYFDEDMRAKSCRSEVWLPICKAAGDAGGVA